MSGRASSIFGRASPRPLQRPEIDYQASQSPVVMLQVEVTVTAPRPWARIPNAAVIPKIPGAGSGKAKMPPCPSSKFSQRLLTLPVLKALDLRVLDQARRRCASARLRFDSSRPLPPSHNGGPSTLLLMRTEMSGVANVAQPRLQLVVRTDADDVTATSGCRPSG
jgi:hypothetical protein